MDTLSTGKPSGADRSCARLGARAHVLELLGQNAVVAALYWALAVLVRWYFSRYQMWPAPLWLSAGVSMFAALSMGRWSWPGIFLGSLLTNTISFSEPFAMSSIVSCGNAVAPILAVELVRDRVRIDKPFSSVADVLFFGLGCFLHGIFSATVGATTFWIKIGAPVSALPARLLEWAMSDAGASLLLAPLPLLVLWNRRSLHQVRQQLSEFVITAAISMGTVAYLICGTTGERAADAGASFLILLPLLWMAVRFSLSVAYPMFVTAMGAVVAATMSGHGPFSGVEKGGTFFIFAQMAIGFGASVLLLGGASNEQRTAEEALRKLTLALEGTVEQRTAELRESQRQLEKAAFYDALTGLPNRRLLEERFAHCGASVRRKGDQLGILLIDLDHFKETNDKYGHDSGDAVLVETACRLTTAVRECDVVARMGGDEFIVLLPETSNRAGIESVCQRIIKTLIQPVIFNGHEMRSTASIGVALFPDHGTTWHLVYKAADLALYSAKRAGRCTWRWHHQDKALVESIPEMSVPLLNRQ